MPQQQADFEEPVRKKRMSQEKEVSVKKECPECGGIGFKRQLSGKNILVKLCPKCNGTGKLKVIAGQKECDLCEGTGNEGIFDGNGDRVGDAPCSNCNGTGKVQALRDIDPLFKKKR